MACMKSETLSKVVVLLIIAGCVGTAVLLGYMFFELPFNSSTNKLPPNPNPSLDALVSSPDDEEEQEAKQFYNNTLTSLEKALLLLDKYPVIDGHNDFPWNCRRMVQDDLRSVNFSIDLRKVEPWASNNRSHTDIPRLRDGRIGGQFWVAYTDCESQDKDSVPQTLEQIDVIHRLIEEYSDDLQFCQSSDDILEAIKNKKIASLIGIEGGHSIISSPGILRQMYRLGVRYLTLTHTCSTPWADAAGVDAKENPLVPISNGMSDFGLELIDEMNRLGMMVDLSHVSEATMRAALARSKAPVIFSHSSSKAICGHHRNVPDDILRLLKENGGIIMINFSNWFIQCDKSKNATLADVADHIDHIRSIIGADHIGLGGDFDGVDKTPIGLEDVSKYPYLIAELIERGWGWGDLRKVSNQNILNVMVKVEKVKEELKNAMPMQSILPKADFEKANLFESCIASNSKSLYKLRTKLKDGMENKKGNDKIDTSTIRARTNSSTEISSTVVESESITAIASN